MTARPQTLPLQTAVMSDVNGIAMMKPFGKSSLGPNFNLNKKYTLVIRASDAN